MLFIAIMVLGLLLGILIAIASKRERPRQRRDDTGVVLVDDHDDPTGLGPGYTWQDVGAQQGEADRLEPGGGDFGGGGASGGWDATGDGDGGD